jgi:hypothetical protein
MKWLLYFSLALLSQTSTYLGPKSPSSKNAVRVEVLVQDSIELGGVTIQSANFNSTEIPLKPRDIYGYRGGASFQLPPGTYKLKWVVQRDKTVWPRTKNHEEKVIISPKDLWIQITINGESASIR